MELGSSHLQGKRLIGWAMVLSLGKCSVSVCSFLWCCGLNPEPLTRKHSPTELPSKPVQVNFLSSSCRRHLLRSCLQDSFEARSHSNKAVNCLSTTPGLQIKSRLPQRSWGRITQCRQISKVRHPFGAKSRLSYRGSSLLVMAAKLEGKQHLLGVGGVLQ